jgi:hypothetical protein
VDGFLAPVFVLCCSNCCVMTYGLRCYVSPSLQSVVAVQQGGSRNFLIIWWIFGSGPAGLHIHMHVSTIDALVFLVFNLNHQSNGIKIYCMCFNKYGHTNLQCT